METKTGGVHARGEHYGQLAAAANINVEARLGYPARDLRTEKCFPRIVDLRR